MYINVLFVVRRSGSLGLSLTALPVSLKKTPLLCERLPRNPAETALQPRIWCSENLSFDLSPSPEECFSDTGISFLRAEILNASTQGLPRVCLFCCRCYRVLFDVCSVVFCVYLFVQGCLERSSRGTSRYNVYINIHIHT